MHLNADVSALDAARHVRANCGASCVGTCHVRILCIAEGIGSHEGGSKDKALKRRR